MPPTITKQYGEYWEPGQDGQSCLVISVRIFHDKQETVLLLCWKAPLGQPVTFSHLQVNSLYMNILTETALLQALSTLTDETTLRECRQFLHQLGFTPTVTV